MQGEGVRDSTAGGQSELEPPITPTVQVYQGLLLVGAYPLTSQGLTIGKARENDIVIPTAQISRSHARIIGEESAWFLEDQASTNGTFVYAGERLVYSSTVHPGPWRLGDQQVIRFGPAADGWRLVFCDPTTTDKPPPVHVDEQRRQVWIRNHPIQLPRDHYTLLLTLYQQAPYPCSYEALCAAINQDRQARKRPTYTELAAADVASLHHLVHRLRARIELDPKQPQLIIHQSHFGYRLQNQAVSDQV